MKEIDIKQAVMGILDRRDSPFSQQALTIYQGEYKNTVMHRAHPAVPLAIKRDSGEIDHTYGSHQVLAAGATPDQSGSEMSAMMKQSMR